MQLSTKERKTAALEESKEQLFEAEDLLKQIDHEIGLITGQNKQIYQMKLTKFKQDLEEARIKVSKMEYQCKLNLNKETAMGWYYEAGASNDHNRFLLSTGHDKENKDNSKVQEASKIESENGVGPRDIEINFNGNRDMASEGININDDNRILNKKEGAMSIFKRHETTSKAILLWIIAIILAIILVIGYFILN